MNIKTRIRWIKDHVFRWFYLEKYIIHDGKKHPVAVICPGGSYRRVCSFVEGLPFAKKLNSYGYSAIVVHYRCGKNCPYPTPQNDLARAIQILIENQERWNLDMDHYSLWGASAGGHLASSFGTDVLGYPKYGLPKPGALILCYPVVTMGKYAHEGSRNYLLGNDQSTSQIELFSIQNQITSNYPNTFLWVGLEDHTVNPANSQMLAEALKTHGIHHKFISFEGVDHGVGLGENLPCENWFEEAIQFWNDCIR